MNFKRMIGLIVLIGNFFMVGVNVYANDNTFSIQPILPQNQIDKGNGYFHLKLGQGDTQVIYVDIKNNTDEKKTLRTSVESATTNINGVVDYSKANNRKDSSLAVDLAKQVKVDSDIEMEPKSTKRIPIEVSMPNEAVDGIVAGGITFEQVNEVGEESVDSHTKVKTKFSYVIALMMQQEDNIHVLPELSLEKIETKVINQKASVTAVIRNVEPAYLNKMQIAVSIKRQSDGKEIYKKKKERMQFAPNSVLEYPTFIENQQIEPGKYRYTANIKGETNHLNAEKNQTLEWTFTEEFEINKEEAKKLSKLSTNDSNNDQPTQLLYLFIALTILLLLIIIFYIIYRFVKNKKENNKNKVK
ncbi:hypothetical protein BW731_04455 [Vagococcus martis]|uniref:Uncharacterized protein n=1 Tax=Vagococcus martis TaxID=1768210 RepID=A0A1V4DG83_9ENTE|nr:DUF916 and DUF3324 domain-containing protein [Vagococcus martis]OPF87505.1 hypothetical protein BW731_04455 [Vagococcus martis]